MKVQQDTSIVVRKPSRGTSTTARQALPLAKRQWNAPQNPNAHFFNPFEYRFHLPGRIDIERHENQCIEFTRQRRDKLLALSLRYVIASSLPSREGLAAPSDGLIIGNADDEASVCLRAAAPSQIELSRGPLGFDAMLSIDRAITSMMCNHQLFVSRHDVKGDLFCLKSSVCRFFAQSIATPGKQAMLQCERTEPTFSPIPAVKTNASSPPSARPTSRH
jgi:hypothetical protein